MLALLACACGTLVLAAAGNVTWFGCLLVGLAAVITELSTHRGTADVVTHDRHLAEPESQDQSSASLRFRYIIHSLLTIVVNPSSAVGPEPLYIPTTGHSLCLQLVVAPDTDATLHGLRAEVTACSPLESSGCALTAGDEPLKIPHFEILLDATPPTIRPALDAHGTLARPTPAFPVRLQPGAGFELVLAPLTNDRRHVFWQLLADLECNGHRQPEAFQLQITAETGWLEFSPGGGDPKVCAAWEVVPHWRGHPLEDT